MRQPLMCLALATCAVGALLVACQVPPQEPTPESPAPDPAQALVAPTPGPEPLSFGADIRDSVSGRAIVAAQVSVDGVVAPQTRALVRTASVLPAAVHTVRFSRQGYLTASWTGTLTPSTRLVARLCPSAVRVVAFGDSITAGLKVAYGDRYTVRLPSLIKQAIPGLAIDVLDRGKVGDTYATARQRMEADVVMARPDITLVELGTNDSYHADPSTFPRTVDALLQPLGGACSRVLVADVPYKPRWSGTFNQQAAPVDQVIAKACERSGASLVSLCERFKAEAARGHWDLFAHDDPYDLSAPDSIFQGDIHPNADGHALMARAFADGIVASIAPGVATASL